MSKKKGIAVSVVLLLVLLIGGMLAYFTDTDTVTNVFTLGDDVEISLTESFTPADAQGIHPGAVVAKAPSIKNDSTTTPAYVFAEVVVPCYATTGTTVNADLFTFTPNSGWTLINTPTINTTTKTKTYVYAYGTSTNMTPLAANTTTSTAVFSNVTLVSTLTEAQAATAPTAPNIVVNAYGIQTDSLGVTTPTAIFALFNN